MIDLATIKVKAGDGGDGVVNFRQERFIPKGGPDGGDGGTGGSIHILADHNMATLMDFRSRSLYKAESGDRGMSKNRKGKDGDDLIIKVPQGTLIYELTEGREILIEDMDEHGKKLLLAKGGRGGVGNYRFRSSTNQAPRQYTKGGRGEAKNIKLEIKIISDVGLIGAPNAGKSTLINALTNAQAKIGSYPFTTLSPNLGVLRLKSGEHVVISDVPGLIEGASQGRGLGDEFLRHIERARLLVHLVDPCGPAADDPVELALQRYDMIQQELKGYKVDLTEKEQIVAINKLDVPDAAEAYKSISQAFKKRGVKVLGISALAQEGLEELINEMTLRLSKIAKKPLVDKKIPVKLYTIDNLPNRRMVFGRSEVHELK